MSKSTPDISVIIPVYNVGQYVGKCLDSLISQTFPNIEIICVNDCSTDNSLEILKSYEARDNRIVVVDLPENIKQGGARNIGIKMARAPYLAFVDSDDWVSHDMYEKLYTLACKNNADIVCSDYYIYYSDSDIRIGINCAEDLFLKTEDERNRHFLIGECRLWTNIYKKEIFINNNLTFPEKLYYEDNAIVAALYLSATKIVKDNHPYYYYRCNNVSTTRSINNYRFFDRLQTSMMFLNNMYKLGIYEKYKDEVEYRFTELFYVTSIIVAISQFDPPAKEYIDQIKRDIKGLFPDFMGNRYYKARVPIKIRVLLRFIYFKTDLGIILYQLFMKLKSLK